MTIKDIIRICEKYAMPETQQTPEPVNFYGIELISKQQLENEIISNAVRRFEQKKKGEENNNEIGR